ncbi:MAG TPA: type I methionyl aminopeptidase, partial [Arthrobacter sp.]|nr:type I methionyl aminopeptidase [Arthrobacter sp.]
MFGRSIEYKTADQMRHMVDAGRVTSEALDAAVAAAVVGATTADLNEAAAAVLKKAGA